MIFKIISILIALILFASSWLIYHKLMILTIKHHLMSSLIVLGTGLLINAINSHIFGDCGLIMVVIGLYSLIVTIVKIQNYNQDTILSQYPNSQH